MLRINYKQWFNILCSRLICVEYNVYQGLKSDASILFEFSVRSYYIYDLEIYNENRLVFSRLCTWFLVNVIFFVDVQFAHPHFLHTKDVYTPAVPNNNFDFCTSLDYTHWLNLSLWRNNFRDFFNENFKNIRFINSQKTLFQVI